MSALGDVLFELDDLLRSANVRYVIGGALALAYYAEPRATADVDLCVSTTQSEAPALAEILHRSGWDAVGSDDPAPIAGVRFRRDNTPIALDIFFSFDEFHRDLFEHARLHRFANGDQRRALPFVSPDDYVVLKLSFSRPKDWVDIGAVLESGTVLDVDYIERQLVGFRGPTFHRHVGRLRHMVASTQADG